MTLALLMLVSCKTSDFVEETGDTDVPTEDTDAQRPIPPVTAERDTVLGHAEECQQALGPIPGFDCSTEAFVVPVTDGGVQLEDAQGACDKPSLLESSCNQFTRVGKKVGTWMNGDVRPEVTFMFTCRSSGSEPDTEEGNAFHDVAMIGHNAETGATCYFQSFPDRRMRYFPSPLTAGATPDYGDRDADDVWLRPASTANIECNRCHSADPWIHSPWVDQVEDPEAAGQPIVPWTEYLGVSEPPGYHIVGSEFSDWRMFAMEPADNACVSCHRIGPGGSCENFVRYSVGANSFMPLTSFAETFPESNWMPPAFGGSEDDWEEAHGEDADQILHCCNYPSDEECNTTEVPLGTVYIDPDGPPPPPPSDTALTCVEPDTELGSTMGEVSTGTTCGMGHDFTRSCAEVGTNSEDVAFRWTAPNAGTFRFDTSGSGFDTTLSFRSQCDDGDDELACDDDGGESNRSRLEAGFSSGETVVVVIDAYEGPDCGDYVLTITEM